jgi:uncharacterized protein (DUF433 family)
MAAPKAYVRVDEHGVMRVADSRVMLDSVVASFEQGYSPETIRQQYPSLSLEDVYGAITYYLANRKEVDDYLQRQAALWQQLRKESEEKPSPVIERLRLASAR